MPERLAKTALCSAFKIGPVRSAAQQIQPESKYFPGYKLLGGGEEQLVYRRGSEIFKLLFNSRHMSVLPPRDIVEKLQTEADICQTLLGSKWNPTEFDLVEHPTTGKQAVASRQPYIKPNVSYRSMSHLATDHSVSSQQKRQFAEDVSMIHETTGLGVDVLGSGNVVNHAGKLVVVDTIVIDQQRQTETEPGEHRNIGQVLVDEVALIAR